MAGLSRQMLNTLEARGAVMETQCETSDAGMLASVLINMTPEEYATRADRLAPLRLLPSAARFQAAIDYWEAAYFRDPPAEEWEDLLPDSFDINAVMQKTAFGNMENA